MGGVPFEGNRRMEGGLVVGSIQGVDLGPTPSAPTTVARVVQGAIDHSHHVLVGLSPPSKTLVIQPQPDQPPAPPEDLAPQKEATPATPVSQTCQQPVRSSSRPTGPALGSGQGAKPKAPKPRSKIPQPSMSTGCGGQPPVLPAPPQGATAGAIPPGVTLESKLLVSQTNQSGYRWEQRQHPYVPWNPSPSQLWGAHCLLVGAGEWAVPDAEMKYLPTWDPRLNG